MICKKCCSQLTANVCLDCHNESLQKWLDKSHFVLVQLKGKVHESYKKKDWSLLKETHDEVEAGIRKVEALLIEASKCHRGK